MNVLNAIASYFRPMGQSSRAHRQENLSVAEANRLAAQQLLREERIYWESRTAKAATHAEREYCRDHIQQINRIEQSR